MELTDRSKKNLEHTQEFQGIPSVEIAKTALQCQNVLGLKEGNFSKKKFRATLGFIPWSRL